MTPERWLEIDRVFQAALERDPGDRRAFLAETCSGDDDLRREVEYLISFDDRERCFIDVPAFDAAANFIALDEPALSAGQHLGHYEILELLGTGGMGEVYLAQDKKLRRNIALKLLPAYYTSDEGRLHRFQQEAQAASALNHPNILTIYELGQVDGQQYIATEFVDGETLRQRIKRGGINIGEALEISIQLAGALAVAHRAGIVHRDIKPENIMLRKDGYVKVLDFGLAKLTEQSERAVDANAATRPDVSSGLVMGTVKYMSPEQARGSRVDPGSDIFSFGVVLYEMLAGRAPFEGETSSELIDAILSKEPPLLTNVSDEMKRVVNRALRKTKEQRYQTIEGLLVDLKALKGSASSDVVQTVSATTAGSVLSTSEAAGASTLSTMGHIVSGIKRHKTSAAFTLAGLIIVGVGLSLNLNRLRGGVRAPSNQMKLTRLPGTDKTRRVAISPNGEYIAYAEWSGAPGRPNAEQSLWVLETATNDRRQIRPPANISYSSLNYSRDGRDIFYVSDEVLYRTSAIGGEATKVLSDVGWAIGFAPDGAQFTFVRALSPTETALMVANVDGSGERVVATRTKPELLSPGGPRWSPDGSLIVCASLVTGKNPQTRLIGFEVPTGEAKWISEQKWDDVSDIEWLPDGRALIAAAGQIWEIPFPTGEAHRLTADLNYSFSSLGLPDDGKNLVALHSAWRSSLWLVPNGDSSAAQPITSGEYQDYRHVSWTIDGQILYASNVGTSRDTWIVDSDGTNPKKLTANAGENLQPEASGDGRYIVFTSTRTSEEGNIWRMDINGSNAVQLTHGSGESQPVCSPDGLWIVYSQGGVHSLPGEKTLWKVPIDGGEPVQLCDHPSFAAAISPDGKLIACWYKPDSSTPWKIAIIPFDGGPPIRTLDGNRTNIRPVRWSPDGQTIDYIVMPRSPGNIANIWRQPIAGGPPYQLTQFTSEAMEGFGWSRDGRLVCARRHTVQDVILISDFR